jgi:hypothetical protein
MRRLLTEALFVFFPFCAVFIGAAGAELQRIMFDIPMGRFTRVVLVGLGAVLGLFAEQVLFGFVDRR